MLTPKRLTLFSGHYGSGKTNIAVNYAVKLRESGLPVTIADLDIVNPYFRMKDSEEEMKARGIGVISLPYANTNVDLPVIPSSAYSLFENRERYAVLDIGGDDRGALALGMFRPLILEENNYDMLFVANFYRPLTPDAASCHEVLLEIEGACGLRFNGIVNNSSLGDETTADTVVGTLGRAEELSRLSGLPVVMTTVHEKLYGELRDRIPDLFPLVLQKKITDAL